MIERGVGKRKGNGIDLPAIITNIKTKFGSHSYSVLDLGFRTNIHKVIIPFYPISHGCINNFYYVL